MLTIDGDLTKSSVRCALSQTPSAVSIVNEMNSSITKKSYPLNGRSACRIWIFLIITGTWRITVSKGAHLKGTPHSPSIPYNPLFIFNVDEMYGQHQI
jgi:hypothetical protein